MPKSSIFNRFSKTFTIAVSLLATYINYGFANETMAPGNISHTQKDTRQAPQASVNCQNKDSSKAVLENEIVENKVLQLMQVEIKVNVPHVNNAVNYFAFYPYPIKPPTIKHPKSLLPTTKEYIKQSLTNSGYSNRSGRDIPYPAGGWRWKEAYTRACQRCDALTPHTYLEVPFWRDKMTPYVLEEINRLNNLEILRAQRYKKLIDIYDEDNRESEAKSAQLGILPVKVLMSRMKHGFGRIGYAKLTPGQWWLVGTHKAPGIIYYWQEPITVKDENNLDDKYKMDGKILPQVLELNEENAIIIDGAW